MTICDCDKEKNWLNKVGVEPRFKNNIKWFASVKLLTQGNVVTPYVFGKCAFEDIEREINEAKDDNHAIYLSGWSLDIETRLATKTFKELLKESDSKNVLIRCLLWENKIPSFDNTPACDFINSLNNGSAILDNHHPPFGSHHQKLIIILNNNGFIAFCGGMDIWKDRIERRSNIEPLHDIHFKIQGPCVPLLLDVFRERWNSHPLKNNFDKKNGKVTFPHSYKFNVNYLGSCIIQIGKTYANCRKLGFVDNANDKSGYPFTQNGESDTSAWEIIKHGIQTAKNFIFLEDQYLVSEDAANELSLKLKDSSFKMLIIVTCKSQISDLKQLVPRRKSFFQKLEQGDPSKTKWKIFSLKDDNDEKSRIFRGSYVHAKTWIFDDLFAVLGSANCNRRGYSYDSEIVVGITNDSSSNLHPKITFAKQLRIMIWRKYFNSEYTEFLNWEAGMEWFYKKNLTTSIITGYDFNEPDPENWDINDSQYNYQWDNFWDPNGK